MCTGAEIPAALAAAASTMGGAGAAAGMGASAALAETGTGLLSAAAPELASMLAPTSAAALSPDLAMAATPMLPAPAAMGAPATSGPASGLMQMLGGMGPEQANILAAQNEGFGMGGLNSTLQAANPTYANLSSMLGRAGDVMNTAGKAQQVAGMFQPQRPAVAPMQRPPQQAATTSITDLLRKRYGLTSSMKGLL